MEDSMVRQGEQEEQTRVQVRPALLEAFKTLLLAHRWAFKQERTFVRMCVLGLGMIFAFARHTLSQGVSALGQANHDPSAYYRLLRGKRFREEDLAQQLATETLKDAPVDEPYVTGVDTTHIVRSSKKMPGSGWHIAPQTAIFKRGLQQAQRFLTCAWLPEIKHGFTRAIPIRFLPAFTEKSAPARVPACKDWAAALSFAQWMRDLLDAAKRSAQLLVMLADAAFDRAELWRALPERVVFIVRTAKNRALYTLPNFQLGCASGRRRRPGRPRKYGDKAPTPQAHLHDRTGWQHTTIQVRGRTFKVRYKVRGCYLRETAPNSPLFLLIVGGAEWRAGKRDKRRARRLPAYFLISAVERHGIWELPFAAERILAWVWQRWELEITHRELKSGFGVGQMQCWNPVSAVLSVQWMVWLYAVMLLAGYRTWGWFGAPALNCVWWHGAQRWSLNVSIGIN